MRLTNTICRRSSVSRGLERLAATLESGETLYRKQCGAQLTRLAEPGQARWFRTFCRRGTPGSFQLPASKLIE
jgi:hypothetical protein